MIIQPARLALLTDYIAQIGMVAVRDNQAMIPSVKNIIDSAKGTAIYMYMFKAGLSVIDWHKSPKTATQHVANIILELEMHVISQGCADGINGVAEYCSLVNSNPPYWGALVHPVFAEQYLIVLGKTIPDVDQYSVLDNDVIYSNREHATSSCHVGHCDANVTLSIPTSFGITITFDGQDHNGNLVEAGWSAIVESEKTTAPLIPTDGHRRIKAITNHTIVSGSSDATIVVNALKERNL